MSFSGKYKSSVVENYAERSVNKYEWTWADRKSSEPPSERSFRTTLLIFEMLK